MSYRSVALGVITATHSWDDFMFIVLSPLLPLLIVAFGLNYLEAGVIIFVFRVSTAILQPFTGYLGDRTGRMKLLLAVGIVWFSLGLFAAGVAGSYVLLLVAVFVAGVGAAVYHPIGVAMLGRIFDRRIGFVLGIHGAGGGFGIFIAPVVASYFASLYGWRPFLMALIVPSVVIAVLIMVLLKDSKIKSEVAISFRGIWSFGIASVAVISFITSMCFTIMITFVPIFLVDIDRLDIVTTGLFTSIMLSAMIFSQPIIGRVYDRFDRFRKEILMILLFGWGISWFLFTVTAIPVKIFFVTLASFCISATWPILFEMMLRMAPKGNVATTVGVVEGITMLGGISSVIFGRMADMAGLSFSLPFAALIAVSAGLLSFFLPKKSLQLAHSTSQSASK